MALSVWDFKVYLDVKDKDANLNFVSHAHSDHTSAVRKKNMILCSRVTKDLVEQRLGYQINLAETPKNVQMLNAGHMLGSRQLYLESCVHGASIVYTGDYLLQKTFASEPIEIKQADILMIDSTYPDAEVVFDDREEVVTSIQRYVTYKARSGCVLFGAYSMGKAQELIGICNDIGIEPVVDDKVAAMTRIYNKHGFSLRFQEAAALSDHFNNDAMIVTMNKLDYAKAIGVTKGTNVYSAVATGFAKMQRFNTDVQFALSDHADFPQAIEYVERSRAKTIYTYGSSAHVMAKNLKEKGYNAAPFDVRVDPSQMALAVFKS